MKRCPAFIIFAVDIGRLGEQPPDEGLIIVYAGLMQGRQAITVGDIHSAGVFQFPLPEQTVALLDVILGTG